MSLPDLYTFLRQETGITLTPQREASIEAWLKRFGLSAASVRADLAASSADAPLWQNMIDLLTIGETYFFRNAAQFNSLRESILPELIAQRRKDGNHYLRLWSAGCATGEEPYSLAMLLNELLHDRNQWSVHILATDINDVFIQRARQGIYGPRSFRNETPDYIQGRWFRADDEGRFHLHPQIKQMVTFAHLNLVQGTYPTTISGTAALDLILCRNVTIYFARETTRGILDRMYTALVPGGWLVVGHSEPQPELYDKFEQVTGRSTILYRRPTIQPAVAAAPPPPPARTVPVRATPAAAPPPPAPVPAPVEVVPPSIDELLAGAQTAANREDWQAAHTLLNEAEQCDSFNPHLHYLRGLIEMQVHDYVAAVRAYRRAIYCDPHYALAYYGLGDACQRQGQHAEARRAWTSARRTIAGRPADDLVADGSDLTVEMLDGLLRDQLEALP